MQLSGSKAIFNDVPDGRRRIMRSIRSSGTKPERLVRSLLHRLGYRFRKNEKELPGRPDISFKGRRKAVFVHGCFWHSHEGCRNSAIPRTRTEYWQKKLERNKTRDQENIHDLKSAGWEVFIIWECELSNLDDVQAALTRFLGKTRNDKAGAGQQ